MIFLVQYIVSLFCDVCLIPGSTWYISYSCGTIWPVYAESSVKHQSTN